MPGGRHGLGRWDLLAADKRLGLGAKLAVNIKPKTLLIAWARHGLGRWDLLAADTRLGLGAKLAVAAVEKRSRGGGGKAAQGDKDLPNGARWAQPWEGLPALWPTGQCILATGLSACMAMLVIRDWNLGFFNPVTFHSEPVTMLGICVMQARTWRRACWRC